MARAGGPGLPPAEPLALVPGHRAHGRRGRAHQPRPRGRRLPGPPDRDPPRALAGPLAGVPGPGPDPDPLVRGGGGDHDAGSRPVAPGDGAPARASVTQGRGPARRTGSGSGPDRAVGLRPLDARRPRLRGHGLGGARARDRAHRRTLAERGRQRAPPGLPGHRSDPDPARPYLARRRRSGTCAGTQRWSGSASRRSWRSSSRW